MIRYIGVLTDYKKTEINVIQQTQFIEFYAIVDRSVSTSLWRRDKATTWHHHREMSGEAFPQFSFKQLLFKSNFTILFKKKKEHGRSFLMISKHEKRTWKTCFTAAVLVYLWLKFRPLLFSLSWFKKKL